MREHPDPCNSLELKAQQKENLQELQFLGQGLGLLVLLSIGCLLFGLAMKFIVERIGPVGLLYLVAGGFVAYVIFYLLLLFQPSLQLYSCLLWNKVRGGR